MFVVSAIAIWRLQVRYDAHCAATICPSQTLDAREAYCVSSGVARSVYLQAGGRVTFHGPTRLATHVAALLSDIARLFCEILLLCHRSREKNKVHHAQPRSVGFRLQPYCCLECDVLAAVRKKVDKHASLAE